MTTGQHQDEDSLPVETRPTRLCMALSPMQGVSGYDEKLGQVQPVDVEQRRRHDAPAPGEPDKSGKVKGPASGGRAHASV
jgi:hypothetical protein